jgi:glutathione synthase/RimK-type ligase-like ATP-grasp enzyme
MTSKVKVAVATCKDDLNCNGDDEKALKEAFEAKGFDLIPVTWNDQHVNWDDYSAIIVRTIFDYHVRAEEFRRWIEERKLKGQPRMWNSPDIILWNMHKHYLEYFRENGITVPETIVCEQGTTVPDLGNVLHEQKWHMAVVKPAISVLSYRTFVIEPSDAHKKQASFEKYVSEGDMMIQKYVKEIERNGEYSLMYIDNVFSHAVQKFPAEGDFRTDPELGGTARLVDPPSCVLKMANKVVSLVKEELLYAKVDVVELANGDVTLIEFEVIEPILYLAMEQGAAAKFVDAFMKHQL